MNCFEDSNFSTSAGFFSKKEFDYYQRNLLLVRFYFDKFSAA